jgi:fatty acid CoA ligase FadD9
MYVLQRGLLLPCYLSSYLAMFGNRLTQIGSGSAAISPECLAWLRKCFKCGVANSYGATEAGGLTVDGRKGYNMTIKLRSVPELGYSVEDKPYPRGEILVKTKTMAMGYFKDPEGI